MEYSERRFGFSTAQKKNNEKGLAALTTISLAMKTNLYSCLKSCEANQDAWKILKESFESKALMRKVLLCRELYFMKLSRHKDTSVYIFCMQKKQIVDNLNDIGSSHLER